MAPEPRQSGEPRWDAHAQRWVWEPAAGAAPAPPQVYGPPPVMPSAPPVSPVPPVPPGQAGQAGPAPAPAGPAYDPLGPGAPGVPGLPPYAPPGQQPPYVSNPPYLPPVPPGPPLSGGARERWLTPATVGIAVAAVLIGAGAVWFMARDTDDANRAGEKNGTVASGAPSLPGTPSDAASPTPGDSVSPDSGASGSPSGSPSPSGTGVHETKQDPAGFTIAVPAGWAREESDEGVFYRSADRSALLQIFRVTEDVSPLDSVKGSSAQRRSTTSGYEEIRVGTVPGNSGAAELVYEYDNAVSHGRRRCVERVLFGPDGSKWAVLTAGPAGEWAATQDHHAAALAAFRPGG
ncbi:hypothetical protein ACIQF5_22800 [Streptomyces goshikiensis]|uniref:hypothetical protein n=1 Tax=Streptomyces goshikiensis TaxID=1942 RepID=UPI0037FA617B